MKTVNQLFFRGGYMLTKEQYKILCLGVYEEIQGDGLVLNKVEHYRTLNILSQYLIDKDPILYKQLLDLYNQWCFYFQLGPEKYEALRKASFGNKKCNRL